MAVACLDEGVKASQRVLGLVVHYWRAQRRLVPGLFFLEVLLRSAGH